MRILAIETSCDETAVAVVEFLDDGIVKVLGEAIASSMKIHVETGGIVPEVAAREQLESMIPTIEESFRISDIGHQDIHAIVVTQGPGLLGSLVVGVETAKTLALSWNKPIIPVNHVMAHLYGNWINNQSPETSHQKPEFPAVGLIVSGGHAEIILMTSHDEYKWLGGTRDDAAGECFDKCARVLGLAYPGGPSIAIAAEQWNGGTVERLLPRPMLHSKNLDMSFSGLKTAVLNYTRTNPDYDVSELAFELQEAIVEVLVKKLDTAIKLYNPSSLLIAGGVAANTRLRDALDILSKNHSIPLHIPELRYCTDNAAMIGAFAALAGKSVELVSVRPNPSMELL